MSLSYLPVDSMYFRLVWRSSFASPSSASRRL
jgi:hypothetical protein